MPQSNKKQPTEGKFVENAEDGDILVEGAEGYRIRFLGCQIKPSAEATVNIYYGDKPDTNNRVVYVEDMTERLIMMQPVTRFPSSSEDGDPIRLSIAGGETLSGLIFYEFVQ